MIGSGDIYRDWCAAATGYRFGKDDKAIGFVRDGQIKAAVVFQKWSGGDVELTAAGVEFPRSLLRACFRYAVGTLGCNRVTFKTPSDHVAAILCDQRLGARLEGVQRKFYPDGRDALVFGLLKEDYPYGKP